MTQQFAEVIVLRSQPDYPQLTPQEERALQAIRLRAIKPYRCPTPIPTGVSVAWWLTLLTGCCARLVLSWLTG